MIFWSQRTGTALLPVTYAIGMAIAFACLENMHRRVAGWVAVIATVPSVGASDLRGAVLLPRNLHLI